MTFLNQSRLGGTPMPDEGPARPLRIGDTEKQECIDHLQAQYAAGRLTHEEFTELSCEAFAARYDKQLEVLGEGFAPLNIPVREHTVSVSRTPVVQKCYLIPGQAVILVVMVVFWLGVVQLIIH